MTKYVALLRGIMPSNPNMHQKKLVKVFEELRFNNVQAVISSGNVIFSSTSKNISNLEAKIEKAWPEKLGFTSTTIIRSQNQLKKIIEKKPFGNSKFFKNNYMIVTFLKRGGELFNVIDTTSIKTSNIMTELEKKHGKQITTRTWQTVNRIFNKMQIN